MKSALVGSGTTLRSRGRTPRERGDTAAGPAYAYDLVLDDNVRRAVDARDPSRDAAHLLRVALLGASKRVRCSGAGARVGVISATGAARRGAAARFVVRLPAGGPRARRSAVDAVRRALAVELATVAAGWAAFVTRPRPRT